MHIEHITEQQSKEAGTRTLAITLRPTIMVGIAMMNRKPSKHEVKTLETRELLLQAAEQVFVRDGYEKADLGEIAELAGRTKGAIYGQFQSKEELFLALVERNALQRRAVMRDLLEKSSSLEGNRAALRKFFIDTAADVTWGLLLLEFRLYTIRYPDVRGRLAKLYKSIVPDNQEAAYSAILGSAGRGKMTVSRAVAVHAAFSMLYGLQVESRFEPELVRAADVKKIAGKVFDALFESE